MLLKSLEIQGFKTFPDKTVLKFNDPYVAVVGPNGSGKSNVSDAIKWVLGEQSVRALRCSRMEDVIFKGASGRKAMGFAEVVLNIDNSSRELNFDNDELSVSRRYYSSGDSEYLINGTQVRLKDINELFMDTGLGRDGYSIISQGKIDSIVSAKSDERREIFEEASGISKFRYRKEESERRLSRTEENLLRLRDIFEEVESRVEPLRVQSEKAERFIELDSEKSTLEVSILYDSYERAEDRLRTQDTKIFTAEADYNRASEYSDSLDREAEEISEKINRNIALIDEYRQSISRLNENAVKAESEITLLRSDISHNEENINRLLKELEDSGTLESFIAEKIEAANSDIEKLNTERNDLELALEERNKELLKLSEEAAEINANISARSEELAKNNESISQKKIELSSVDSVVSEIANRGLGIDAAIAAAKDETENLKLLIEKKTAEIEKSDAELAAKKNIFSGYTKKIEGRENALLKLKSDIDRLTLDIGENTRRAGILEDLEKNYEGYNQSVKAVLRESEHGRLSGIHGPVSKILRVQSEFSAAIETALGQSLQNIVVDDERSAHSAIDFLKRRNIGRATFLPLTTISGNELSSGNLEKYRGFIGVASELADCDEKYLNIKRFLLGRIIIADNLDNAGVIAKGISYRNRIVTLDGQVINAGGSFTGGSLSRNAGILNRSNEIKAFREKAAELSEEKAGLVSRHKNISEDVSVLKAESSLLQTEISDLSAELIRENAELEKLRSDKDKTENSLSGLLEEKEDSAKRVTGLNEERVSLESAIAELSSLALGIEAELKLLQDDLAHNQTAFEEQNTFIQNSRITLVTLEKDISVLSESIAAYRSQMETRGESAGRMNSEIDALRAKNQLLLKDIEEKKKVVSDFRADSAGKDKEIESISSDRENLEKLLREKRELARTASSDKEKLSGELAVLKEQTESFRKELSDISAKLWDEYELSVLEAGNKAEKLADVNASKKRLNELKNKIRALGSVNVGAVVEYKEVKERYEFLKVQIGDVNKSRIELLKIISELTTNMETQFEEKFAEINKNFSEIFAELFGGGKASLSFTNADDMLNSGIEIKVHPPGKIVSHIEALSGGEKALVAIAIYFAIMKVSPPPFCMLDEVEAALDDENVRRFADYLHRMNDRTQFIVITHRRGTMESAQSLFGVTMQDDGISKILVLDSTEVDSTMAS